MSSQPRDITADEKLVYRLESVWTSEETAHRLLETIVTETDINRDALSIEEGRLGVDDA